MTNEQLTTWVSSSWVYVINIAFCFAGSLARSWHESVLLGFTSTDLVDLASILFNSAYLALVALYFFRQCEKHEFNL